MNRIAAVSVFLGMAIIVSLFAPHSVYAQRVARRAVARRPLPRHYGSVNKRVVRRGAGTGTAHLRRLPAQSRRIHVGGRRYYRHENQYYSPYYYGNGVYGREVDAPSGAEEYTFGQLAPTTHKTPEENLAKLVRQKDEKEQEDEKKQKENRANKAAGTGLAAPLQDPMAILERMQAYLRKQTAIRINFHEEHADPQPDGTFETVKRLRSIAVRRPNRLRAAGQEGDTTRRFYYDGSSATVYDVEHNAYAVVPFNGPNADLLDHLRDVYGVTVPLTDFLRADSLKKLRTLTTDLQYMGREEMGGKPCDALVFLTDDAECRVWIQATENLPLLRRVEILYSKHPGEPKYAATIVGWIKPEENFDDQFFTFTAPEGADQIDILPVEEDAGTDDENTTKP